MTKTKSSQERLVSTGIKREPGWLYYLSKDGWVCRVKATIGGKQAQGCKGLLGKRVVSTQKYPVMTKKLNPIYGKVVGGSTKHPNEIRVLIDGCFQPRRFPKSYWRLAN